MAVGTIIALGQKSDANAKAIPVRLDSSKVTEMIGTIVNAGAIITGGTVGLFRPNVISPARQVVLKQLLGALSVYVGLSLVWNGLNGTFSQALRQFLIVLAAMILGKLTGRLMHLQSTMNGLGQYAKKQCSMPAESTTQLRPNGFITCSILFCLQPLAILGCLQDGLLGNLRVLLLKAVLDGLTSLSLAGTFGWSVLASAIPVLAYQGTITLLVMQLEPFLHTHDLLDSITMTCGLMVFSVALVILGLKKIEMADYLPSLVIAPLLTWWWR
jgi:uncharacterized protein